MKATSREPRSLLENAAQRASHSELGTFRHLLKWETFWGFGGKLRRKLDQLWLNPGLEDLEEDIRIKASMSKKIVIAREQADDLLQRVRGSSVPVNRPGRGLARRDRRAEELTRSVSTC